MIIVNNKNIEFSKFPNQETLVNTEFLNNIKNQEVCVKFKYEQDEDLLHLYFVLSHLKSLNKIINLIIYYMPYSRMDRSQNGSCFTLAYICDQINNILSNTDLVSVVEPHSDVTLDLLNNSCRIPISCVLAKQIMSFKPIDLICYPDKGARKRFNLDAKPCIYCEKIRDFNTGNILGLKVCGDSDIQDKNILIIDDLCSKGGTFFHTANKLIELGAKSINLCVCHMEKTVMFGDILETTEKSVIDHIFCMDTMLDSKSIDSIKKLSSNITIYNFDTLLEFNEWKEI